MPVTLPDATKFDSDSDKISESRPELKKMADAINTIGAEYNAGTLGGGDRSSYGTRQNLGTITSAGTYSYTLTGTHAYIGFDVSTGTTDVTIEIPDQAYDSEVTVVAHRFSTDGGSGSHTIRIDIIDTKDSALASYTYVNNGGVGAIGTLYRMRKFQSNETGRDLYATDTQNIGASDTD